MFAFDLFLLNKDKDQKKSKKEFKRPKPGDQGKD